MSKTTAALEALVAEVLAVRPAASERSTPRQRAAVDRAYARILRLIAPRIRHFTRQYGLLAHAEDAEQVAAIAVHRAIEAYDPEKAQFTTFVNWQIRGEMQSLRFRLMTDQRQSAKAVAATTVSIHQVVGGGDGEEISLETLIEDEDALDGVEAGASDYLAARAARQLVDVFIQSQRADALEQLKKRPKPKHFVPANPQAPRPVFKLDLIDPAELSGLEQRLRRDREIVEARVLELAEPAGEEDGVTKERVRQIGKRAARDMAELARNHPRFRIMADYRAPSRAMAEAA